MLLYWFLPPEGNLDTPISASQAIRGNQTRRERNQVQNGTGTEPTPVRASDLPLVGSKRVEDRGNADSLNLSTVSSKSAWATQQVPGLPRLCSETLCPKK